MTKITISQKTIDNFKEQILSNFIDKNFQKKEDKKIKWSISLSKLNSLISKKLKKYDNEIDLGKLIILDYKQLCNLKDFIDKNNSFTRLTTIEKDYFYTLYKRLKKASYIKDLDVSVCPYCNRNYIFNFSKNSSLEATAQLDHFFDKNTYPYFAVTIYNLVPSCSTCNQRKYTKKDSIYHPFIESFNNYAKFELKIKDSQFFYDINSFDINIKKVDNTKVQSHVDTFNIENLYNEHKDIVLELIQKAQIYNESYLDELMKKYEGTLFKNREDLMRLITCGYMSDEDLHKRPLSKLIKDISEELDLI